MRKLSFPGKKQQSGVVIVEFAICCLLFFTVVFGILEFGRMMYVYNTMQEVTRRGARIATIVWVDKSKTIIDTAMFGTDNTYVPGAPEITRDKLTIKYLTAAGAEVSAYPTDPGDNMSACNDVTRTTECIRSVSVSLDNVTYAPMVTLFSSYLSIAMPSTKVVMSAESLGFND